MVYFVTQYSRLCRGIPHFHIYASVVHVCSFVYTRKKCVPIVTKSTNAEQQYVEIQPNRRSIYLCP